MWFGKHKAVTFSFDDGVTQDERAIEILDKYGLKGTFNVNSGTLGKSGELDGGGIKIAHNKFMPERVKEIYKNHEVAVHTVTHPNLTKLSEEEIIYQVEGDRKALSDLVGYPVFGMAYPCGGVNNDDRVAEIIKNNTPIKYSRTITSTYSFDLQENLLRFNPTVYYVEVKKLFELADEFINLKTEEDKVFYIWGHTYEMDGKHISWEDFDRFCKLISGKEDIFYGTNSQVLLYK